MGRFLIFFGGQFFLSTKTLSISCYGLYSKIMFLAPVGDWLGEPLKKFETLGAEWDFLNAVRGVKFKENRKIEKNRNRQK